MIPSAQAINEWRPELDWNLAEAERILARLTAAGTDPPGLQATRRAQILEATR